MRAALSAVGAVEGRSAGFVPGLDETVLVTPAVALAVREAVGVVIPSPDIMTYDSRNCLHNLP